MMSFSERTSIEYWPSIIREWIAVNQSIYGLSGGKFAPYCYRERPNVSVLATAATRSGWFALEECHMAKNDGLGEAYDGRADLRLWRDLASIIVEAKITYDSIENLPGKIALRSKQARLAATSASCQPADQYIAVTFAIPRIPAKVAERAGVLDDVIARCESLVQDWPHGIAACTFPGCVARVSGDRKDQGMVAPGIILLGEVIDAQ